MNPPLESLPLLGLAVVHAFPQPCPLMLLHLHLLSDSTGETLEGVAKAGLAQFDAPPGRAHAPERPGSADRVP